MQVTIDDEIMDSVVVQHLTNLYNNVNQVVVIFQDADDLSEIQQADLDADQKTMFHLRKVIQYLLSPSDYNDWMRDNHEGT